MSFYIYQYFDPIRNEIIYVGKGTGNRAYHHLRRKDKHPLTQRLGLMREQGVEPVITVNFCKSENEALVEETALIESIGRKDLGKGSLLNLTNGGDGVSGRLVSKETILKLKRPLSEEHKLAISNSRKGQAGHALSSEHKIAISTAHKGKTFSHSESSKIKISESKKGKKRAPFSEETKQRMKAASNRRWKNDKDGK